MIAEQELKEMQEYIKHYNLVRYDSDRLIEEIRRLQKENKKLTTDKRILSEVLAGWSRGG